MNRQRCCAVLLAALFMSSVARAETVREKAVGGISEEIFATDLLMMPVIEEGLCLGGDECAKQAKEPAESPDVDRDTAPDDGDRSN